MSIGGPRPNDTEDAKYLAGFISPYLPVVANARISTDGTTITGTGINGNQLSSGTSFSTVFQSIVNQMGTAGNVVYVNAGTYSVDAGVDLKGRTTWYFAPGATFQVPQGYNSYVFSIKDTFNVKTHGGRFIEAGTPAQLWDAFLLSATNSPYVYGHVLRDAEINNCRSAITLAVNAASSFVNSNTFEHFYVTDPTVLVDYQYNNGTSFSGATGMHQNVFYDVTSQYVANQTTGFNNVLGSAQLFISCKVWDLAGAGASMNILATSNDNWIIGGAVTNHNFSDAGTRTQIIDGTQFVSLKQLTCVPTSTTSGFNPGSLNGNPSGAVGGDMWYSTATNTVNTKFGSILTRLAACSITNAWGALQPFTGMALNYVTTSSGISVGSTHDVIGATGGAGGITITLPAANANNGRIIRIVKADNGAGAITVARAGADTIEGATSLSLATQYKKCILISDGSSNWYDFGTNLV